MLLSIDQPGQQLSRAWCPVIFLTSSSHLPHLVDLYCQLLVGLDQAGELIQIELHTVVIPGCGTSIHMREGTEMHVTIWERFNLAGQNRTKAVYSTHSAHIPHINYTYPQCLTSVDVLDHGHLLPIPNKVMVPLMCNLYGMDVWECQGRGW